MRALSWLLRSTASVLAGLVVVCGLVIGVARAQGSIGGNGGGGGGLAQAAADLLYCALAGCTMTGATTYSGVTIDVTSATNEDLRSKPGGSGVLRQTAGSGNTIVFEKTDSTAIGYFDVGNASGFMMKSSGFDGAVMLTASNPNLGGGVLGAVSNQASTNIVGAIADSISTAGTATFLFTVRGEGTVAIARQQALTCVANAGAGGTLGGVTFTQTSSAVYVTNPDTDGCIVTVGETDAALGSDVEFVVVSNAGGVITFPAAANVHAGPTFATTTGLGLNDSYRVHYTDMANDMWVGVVATDN